MSSLQGNSRKSAGNGLDQNRILQKFNMTDSNNSFSVLEKMFHPVFGHDIGIQQNCFYAFRLDN